jgi:formate-dependent nitrite reductase membrane component NrfD
VSARPATQPAPSKPVIKAPVWTWEIPFYFYTDDLAGASAGLSRLAEASGNPVLARRASGLALAGAVASPALLISDLGRPERFLNMLRMFKVTSPMSVGSWILAGFGSAAGAGWLDHVSGGRVPGGRHARTVAAVLGMPLASYTAVLVANTAVPAWHESRRILPFVFVAGAGASAGAGLLALTPPRHAAPARRLAFSGAVAEIGLATLMERRLGELSDAYSTGAAHKLGIAAKVLLAGGAAATLRSAGSRRAAVTAGALVTAGAVLARWSVFRAGFQSAADPRHTIASQRA